MTKDVSLLIDGMKMPTSCPCSLVGIGYDVYCFAVYGIPKRYLEYDLCCENGTRPDWCPLVEVPTPHGRLGDLDALYEKFASLESEAMSALKTKNTGSTDWIKWSAILTERTGYKFDIADAPTIIPAEEA